MSKRVTLFLKPSTIKKARAQAIEEETTLSGLAEKALDEYLPRIVRVTITEEDKEGNSK